MIALDEPASSEMHTYVFYMNDGWYHPVNLRSDAEARATAEVNPKTVKVTKQPLGEIVWKKP